MGDFEHIAVTKEEYDRDPKRYLDLVRDADGRIRLRVSGPARPPATLEELEAQGAALNRTTRR